MNIFKNLVIFEMANNHMGDLQHAYNIIDEYQKLVKPYKKNFKFAFKLQYRDLDTFIHPSMKKRTDINYIKRFLDTKLSTETMNKIIKYIRKKKFIAIATAFDEKSVSLIKTQKLDYIKVASCSYNDWPLLEEVAKIDLPTIISTAGASQDELDKVIAFFKMRNIKFSIMHCVGEYPTSQKKLNLNRIALLNDRYKDITVGYSSHEEPGNNENVLVAYGAGARLFEKHVALPTTKYTKNQYSTDLNQMKNWLKSLNNAFISTNLNCTINSTNKKEIETLRKLQRGVFVNKNIKSGTTINKDNVYFAFPAIPGQLTANDYSKYTLIRTKKNLKKNDSINFINCYIKNNLKEIYKIIKKIKIILKNSKVNIPRNVSLEISHHYGINKFYKFGLTMITLVNRRYCKKLLIMLPNQAHPHQFHKIKEETFIVIYGSVDLNLDGKKSVLSAGDTITIKKNQIHYFKSRESGCVIEELSSTHIKSDSYYIDKKINKNLDRKTIVNHWI